MKKYSITTWMVLFIIMFFAMSMSTIAFASPNIDQGDAAFAKRDIARAIQQYQIELKNNPESVIARTKLARCYLRKGYKSATLNMVDEAIALAPNNVEALILKSKLYIWNDQIEDAVVILNKVQLLSPNNIEAYTDLASIYNNIGETQAADELYLKIEALSKSN